MHIRQTTVVYIQCIQRVCGYDGSSPEVDHMVVRVSICTTLNAKNITS